MRQQMQRSTLKKQNGKHHIDRDMSISCSFDLTQTLELIGCDF